MLSVVGSSRFHSILLEDQNIHAHWLAFSTNNTLSHLIVWRPWSEQQEQEDQQQLIGQEVLLTVPSLEYTPCAVYLLSESSLSATQLPLASSVSVSFSGSAQLWNIKTHVTGTPLIIALRYDPSSSSSGSQATDAEPEPLSPGAAAAVSVAVIAAATAAGVALYLFYFKKTCPFSLPCIGSHTTRTPSLEVPMAATAKGSDQIWNAASSN